MRSGAQKFPVNPGTALVVQAGGLENTLGPALQYFRSEDDFEEMPCPVKKT
jgi:hypothetical protein